MWKRWLLRVLTKYPHERGPTTLSFRFRRENSSSPLATSCDEKANPSPRRARGAVDRGSIAPMPSRADETAALVRESGRDARGASSSSARGDGRGSARGVRGRRGRRGGRASRRVVVVSRRARRRRGAAARGADSRAGAFDGRADRRVRPPLRPGLVLEVRRGCARVRADDRLERRLVRPPRGRRVERGHALDQRVLRLRERRGGRRRAAVRRPERDAAAQGAVPRGARRDRTERRPERHGGGSGR